MKKMKKFLAMALAVVMVLGMSVTALADEPAKPETKSATITVKGTGTYTNNEGEEVAAADVFYLQIIKPDQTTETGWSFVNDTIKNAYLAGYNQGKTPALSDQGVIQELIDARKASADGYANSAEIGRALSKVAALNDFTKMEYKDIADGTTAACVDVTSAGVYAIKAAQTGYTYNTMAAYVGFGKANDGTYPVLVDATLIAKKSKIDLDKSHDDTDKVSAIGQIVNYTIETYVPFIDPAKENKTYFIYDEITGADYVLNEKETAVVGTVKMADATSNEAGSDVPNAIIVPTTPNKEAEHAFYIDLCDLINDENSNAGKKITVTYSAKVTAVNVDNTAKAGHKTGETYGGEFGEDDEDVYTGKITLTKTGEADDEKLANAGFEVTDESNSIVYFTKDGDGVYSHVETGDIPENIKAALDDAADAKSVDMTELEQTGSDGKIYVRQVFTKDSDDPEEKGTVVVQGLNVGTYNFTEKTAPEGYSVNETPAKATLVITKENGGEEASDGTLVATKNIEASTGMSDTRLSALPSTGGIGTTIFTIGGCVIMIVAAGLFFASRRKKDK